MADPGGTTAVKYGGAKWCDWRNMVEGDVVTETPSMTVMVMER